MNVHAYVKTATDAANQGRERLYAWLRWLVLLAAGFFSLMAGQFFGKEALLPLALLPKLALTTNALGILLGAVALYGEPASARRLASAAREQAIAVLEGRATADGTPISAAPPRISQWAEPACYASLLASLLAWSAFVLIS